MSEKNRSIAVKFYNEQDRLKGNLPGALVALDYVAIINGGPPVSSSGHEEMGAMFWGAFPDIRQAIEETIAEGDRVAVRFTMHASHLGDFMGTPASGKKVAVSGIGILRIVDGKVAEFREEIDLMGLMQQIGALPAH